MPGFAELIQQGAANAWLFVPSAILLGALHGLEPGHSKTMMAAFIIAIRGTVAQAVMLGLAATISHTAVVWIIALGGMYLWRGVAPEAFEPYFQLLSGLIIIAMALWMLWRVREDRRLAQLASGHDHHDHGHHEHHGHDQHAHDHGHDETRRIDTGHGVVELSVFEDGVPPRWRLRTLSGGPWFARDVVVTTERPDGTTQKFIFRDRNGYLESYDEIPEPHQFMARVSLGHGNHSHDYDLSFVEGHGHDHLHEQEKGLQVATDGYQDAHELAHANDIRKRFQDRNVTNWQIVVFGLTGGLIPCPAAITVLLLCLQLKEITIGAVLVLCFSIGLALTLVVVGVAAALSIKHASKRISWFSTVAQRAPYFSGLLIIAVGIYVSMHGMTQLMARGT
jgi:nickel/cobalt transporter (NicO) family protein